MSLDLQMNIGQYQKILMTPQLDYSLKILRLNNEELMELISEEMLINPLLEYKEPDETISKTVVVDNEINERPAYNRFNSEDEDDEVNYINSIPDYRSIKPNLTQYLLLQLHTQKRPDGIIKVCEYLIECINDNGYLNIDTKELAKEFQVKTSIIEKCIGIIQELEPPGIGARNLKECLKLQLFRKKIHIPHLNELIEKYLDLIALNKIPQVALAMGVSIDYINQLLDIIKTLEPRPGSSFNTMSTCYIKPDIIVSKLEDTFQVAVNKEHIPDIQINRYYSGLLSSKCNLVNEEYNYINKHYQSASWLIRCIEQRGYTLERVAKAIVERQIQFFDLGEKHLMPLTLKEIAEELELHESTISRAVNGKYLLCSWGTYELKYFFSSKAIKREIGEDGSSAIAKYEIKQLIEGEDKKNPFSDTAICERLKEKSIHISRRTVAKYRTQLNIPPMDIRKRY